MVIQIILLIICLCSIAAALHFRRKFYAIQDIQDKAKGSERHIETALKQMQDLQQYLVDASRDGIVLIDSHLKILVANAVAIRFFKNPMVGETVVAAMRYQSIHDLIQQTSKSETNETLLETKEGLFQVTLSGFSISQEPMQLMTLHDVTALNRAKRARHEMVSNISHELRHPITNIGLLTETLLDPALRKSKKGRKMLQTIQREVDTLKQLVQEMQDLARIESGQMPIKLVPLLLKIPIENGTEPHRALAEAKSQTITIDVPENLAALADPLHIERVVRNIVHNAIKYTPEGGKIQIQAVGQGEEVVVSIADTGPGIPQDEQARIFERFYQVDKSRHDGTGLGLAIARHIILAHGGRIWVESTQNHGSTFFFTLPLSNEVNKI